MTERSFTPLSNEVFYAGHDKENIVPTDVITTEEPGLDWREIVRSIFHKDPEPRVEEVMGNNIEHMDETACYGDGICQLTDVSKARTFHQNNKNSSVEKMENRVVKPSEYTHEQERRHMMKANVNISCNQTMLMEETKPIGGILSSTDCPTLPIKQSTAIHEPFVSPPIEETKTSCGNLNFSVNYAVPMEETKAIGGILNSSVNYAAPMEETKTEGEILNLSAVPMEETKAIGRNLNSSVIYSAPIEETKAVRGILNSSVYHTVEMEETKAVGGILDSSVNHTVAMEETKAVGGILDSSVNHTVAMEETKAVGGILDSSVNHTVAMEETKAVGGILNSSTYHTVAMEETKAVREIIDWSVHQTVNMEETKVVGGILNVSSNYAVPMEKTNTVPESSLIQSFPVGQMKSTDHVPNKTLNQTVDMEETEAVGTIKDRSIASKTVLKEKEFEGISSSTHSIQISKEDNNLPDYVNSMFGDNKMQDKSLVSQDSDNYGFTNQSKPDSLFYRQVDEGVSFKCLKRPLDKTGDEAVTPSEKTQEFTQSTGLLRLKEKLMVCTMSTAAHIKTPSKHTPTVQRGTSSLNAKPHTQFDLSMRSPAHKRQCLYMGMDEESTDKVDPTAALLQDFDGEGITDIRMNFTEEGDTTNLIGMQSISYFNYIMLLNSVSISLDVIIPYITMFIQI